MRPRLLLMLVAAFAATVMGLSAQISSAAGPAPTFSPVACPLKLPPGLVEGKDVTCGWLSVPESHSRPDGQHLRLLVVRVSSIGRAPRPDPVVLAQGGPGGSTIDSYLSRLDSQPFLREDRDVILFDQRGTLHTEPALLCDEVLALVDRTIEQDLTPEESDRQSVEANVACRNRLVARGDNLADFNSVENAEDINDLRAALGYDKINLYGVSYGTLLALEALRLHPDGLRSVILDGVVPPQSNFIAEAPGHNARALRALFDACAASPDCNSAYPNLESVFYATYDRMNASPARVPMRDRDAGKEYNALVKGDFLVSGIIGSLYITEAIPGIPKMIYDARDGRYDAIGRISSLLVFDRTMSYGMYFSVVCAESRDFELSDLDLDRLTPQLARESRRGAEGILQTCQQWGVPDIGSKVNQPVRSDVPVVLFSGAFDPITPAESAATAATTLSRSYQFTFPSGGHGALFDHACANTMAVSFLNDPSRAPDSSCLASETPPAFLTASNTVFAPSLARAMLGEPTGLAEAYVLGGSAFVMLTGLVLWPLAWLVRTLRHSQASRRLAWGRRVGIANCLAAVGLTAGLVYATIEMSQANSLVILFGLPGQFRPLLLLVALSCLLTIVACTLVVMAWSSRAWSLLGRLYYTVYCLAAIAAVVIMVRWDLLSALLR
jgi:pimeloyl-ACP methyl ester carboxylesterase